MHRGRYCGYKLLWRSFTNCYHKNTQQLFQKIFENQILHETCGKNFWHVSILLSNNFEIKEFFKISNQLDVLTQENGQALTIHDILDGETLLSLFAEFLESLPGGNHKIVLDFWIRAINYKKTTQDFLLAFKSSDLSRENSGLFQTQAEAREIFHLFIADDASLPLGFDSEMRLIYTFLVICFK